MKKAVFFDRDGTLNVDVHYLHRIEDFQWMPEAVEAIAYCHRQGYLVVVVTNQRVWRGATMRKLMWCASISG